MPREHDRNGGPVALPCAAYACGVRRIGSAVGSLTRRASAVSNGPPSPSRVQGSSLAVFELHSPAAHSSWIRRPRSTAGPTGCTDHPTCHHPG